jgi:predicted nucleotidyltransferase
MHPDSALVDHLVRQIVATVRPLRVVLFGSAARGEMGPESDLDLLVVMPEGTHRRKTAQQLYRTLDGRGRPVDLIVATPSDLDKHKDNVGLIYRDVLREGREVYAA